MPRAKKITINLRMDFPSELLKPLPKKKCVNGKWINATEWRALYMSNLYLLLDRLGIARNHPRALSKLDLGLLAFIFPGFREQRQGRRQDNRLAEKKKLLLRFFEREERMRPGLRVSMFCTKMAKSKNVAYAEFHGTPAETLRRWLRDAQQSR
jgi:hypothetical protein